MISLSRVYYYYYYTIPTTITALLLLLYTSVTSFLRAFRSIIYRSLLPLYSLIFSSNFSLSLYIYINEGKNRSRYTTTNFVARFKPLMQHHTDIFLTA